MGKCISKRELEYFFLTKDNVKDFVCKYFNGREYEVKNNYVAIKFKVHKECYMLNKYYIKELGKFCSYSLEEFNKYFDRIE